MIARVPLPAHRLWRDADGDVAADGAASYSVRLIADRVGNEAEVTVRLALYHFDDLNPTEDPESALLKEVELHADVRHGRHEIILDIPADSFQPVDGLVPNAALPYLSLLPPGNGDTVLRVWELSLVEWRPGEDEAVGWAAIDWLRGSPDACGPVELRAVEL